MVSSWIITCRVVACCGMAVVMSITRSLKSALFRKIMKSCNMHRDEYLMMGVVRVEVFWTSWSVSEITSDEWCDKCGLYRCFRKIDIGRLSQTLLVYPTFTCSTSFCIEILQIMQILSLFNYCWKCIITQDLCKKQLQPRRRGVLSLETLGLTTYIRP